MIAVHGNIRSEITLANGILLATNAIQNAAELQTLHICVKHDPDSYDVALIPQNASGSFSANLRGASVHLSQNYPTPLNFGTNINSQASFDNANGIICISYQIPQGTQNTCFYIVFRWQFRVNYPSGTVDETVLYPVQICVGSNVIEQFQVQFDDGEPLGGNICDTETRCIEMCIADRPDASYQVLVSIDGGDFSDASNYIKSSGEQYTPIDSPAEMQCPDPPIDATCEAVASSISTLSNTTVCVGDGEPDQITVAVSGGVGTMQQWILTDASNTIEALPGNINTFDFESSTPGRCYIYLLHYESVTGLQVGNSIFDIQGCFGLSNGIEVIKMTPEQCDDELCTGIVPSLITTESPTQICTGDGEADIIEVLSSGGVGLFSLFIVVDQNGNIVAISANGVFDFEGTGYGTVEIIEITYNSRVANLNTGNNISDLEGCFELSNSILVQKEECDDDGDRCPTLTGAVISTNDDVVLVEGQSLSQIVNVSASGGNGSNAAFVVVDESGTIQAIQTDSAIDFQGYASAVYSIYQIDYEYVSGLSLGQNIALLQGCFADSNAIAVTKINTQDPNNPNNPNFDDCCGVEPAEIVTCDVTEVCIDDVPSIVDVQYATDEDDNQITGAGDVQVWLLVDENGVIVDDTQSPPFDFSGASTGLCLIYSLHYKTGEITGSLIGVNIDDLEGCFVLSNAIGVNKIECAGCAASAGVISTNDDTNICL